MLELECLSCGFKWDTDDEDEAVQGTCPVCNEYIYNECGELDRFLFPLQSDYDYTCHCEDAPCCGCNSEQGSIVVLYCVMVAIFAALYVFIIEPMFAGILGGV